MLKSILFVLIVSFFIATIIGPFFIPFLRRLKFGQSIREEGPQSHRKKSGTPTMGGIIFMTSIVVCAMITVFFTPYATMSHELIMLLLTLVGFGMIGFIDDFIIVVRKNNEGLKPKQKLLAQLILAAVFFYLYLRNGYPTTISFFNLFELNLYWIYGLFILFWMVGFSNAVNLTDGLDGSGMVLVVTGFVMLFICGVPIRYFMYFILTGIAGIVVLILSAPYRLERITAYLDPWSDPIGSGFQIIQSLYAIAPGGLFGAGLGNSVQKYFYLPEPQTDFIFAIVSEELGFIGSIGTLILFILFFTRCSYIILKTDDLFGKYIVVGIMSMLIIQVMINIGVVIGLIPVTGITLPFMSYGGSSLTITLLSIGIILNISRNMRP